MKFKTVYVVTELTVFPSFAINHRTCGVYESLNTAIDNLGQDESDLEIGEDHYQKYWTHKQEDYTSGGMIYLKITEDKL